MINLKLLDTRYDEFVKKLQGKNVKPEVLNELLTTFNELKAKRQALENFQAIQNAKSKELGIKARNGENTDELKNELNLTHSLITISEEGIALLEDAQAVKFPALAKEVFDVTGAGDTVLATLGYMLANGADIKEAIKIANLAAAVVVAKIGSATASFSEIEQLLNSSFGANFEHKLKSLEELEEILSQKDKKKVVFTNGCFDILHAGHVSYLAKAREFGDILVVGLNSDASVRALKGDTRPVNAQADRATVLAALGAVDYVTIFDELTPLNLIEKLRPDVLVKGADYEGKEVVGSSVVKDVRLVDFVAGKSTSATIKRIKNED